MPRKTSKRNGTGRKDRAKSGRGRRSGPGGGQRKRVRHLDGVKDINPSDNEFLRQFVTEHGKIVPARLTGATARQQRQIKRAVRNARVTGFLP